MEIKKIDKPIDISELSYTFDPEPLASWVKSIDPLCWNITTFRQNEYKEHSATQAIIVLWNPVFLDYCSEKFETRNNFFYDKIKYFLENCFNFLSEKYEGKICRIMLTKLKANSQIAIHQDGDISLLLSHRIHIPIITNDKVTFTVENNTINMISGKIYEINNNKMHGCSNDSQKNRIHLIVDIFENSLTHGS